VYKCIRIGSLKPVDGTRNVLTRNKTLITVLGASSVIVFALVLIFKTVILIFLTSASVCVYWGMGEVWVF
jgi:hypothetical protein